MFALDKMGCLRNMNTPCNWLLQLAARNDFEITKPFIFCMWATKLIGFFYIYDKLIGLITTLNWKFSNFLNSSVCWGGGRGGEGAVS